MNIHNNTPSGEGKESLADSTITYSYASNKNATLFHPRTESLSDFEVRHSEHEPARREAGPAVVYAELVKGQCRATAVSAVSALAVEVDNGTSGDKLVNALHSFGHRAVVFSTFGHGAMDTLLPHDAVYRRVLRWNFAEVDQVGMVRYLREIAGWDEALLATVKFMGLRQTPQGLMILLTHAPRPAFCVVFPLAQPFVPTTAAATHADGLALWKAVACAVPRALGLPTPSREAQDPARLVFAPRCRLDAHADALPPFATMVKGPSLDWRDLTLAPPPSDRPNRPDAPTFASIKAMIAAGAESPSPVLESIATLDSEPERESLYKALAKVVGGSVVVMRKAVAALRAPADGGADGVVTLDDGHRVLTYAERFDAVEACAYITTTMKVANVGGPPTYAQKMGAPMLLKRHGGKLTYEAATAASFFASIAKRCSFSQHREGAPMIRDLPDSDIVRAVYESIEPEDLPAQPSILHAPTIGADGALLDRDGYYPDHDALVDLGDLKIPPVPSKPTAAQVATARTVLEAVVSDFPFDDGDEGGKTGNSPASHANALAMIMTPFVRRLFDGPSPVFGVVAPSAGSGKTLLATVPQVLADGRASVTTANPSSEAEWDKQIGAICQAAGRFVFIDNAEAMSAQALLRTTTSRVVGARLLGQSRMIERPNDLQWIYTGVNTRLSSEMVRRVVAVNLNTRTAENGEREYSHPDFDGWLLANRGEIIAAILTLARAWIAKGSKPCEVNLPSFNSWAATLGGILKTAGVEGFLKNKRAPRADREGAEIIEFIAAWWGIKSITDVDDRTAFDLAEGIESTMVKGFGSERRPNFLAKLDGLRGRTFDLDEVTVMLAVTDDGWKLVKLADRVVKA